MDPSWNVLGGLSKPFGNVHGGIKGFVEASAFDTEGGEASEHTESGVLKCF